MEKGSGSKPKAKTTPKKAPVSVIEKAIDMCLKAARKNAKDGFRPFAAVLVPTDIQEHVYKSTTLHPLICAVDRVEQDSDPSAHAELLAVRKACKKYRKTTLAGYTMVSVAFPCPMCISLLDWARIDGFYYCLPLQTVRIRNQEEMYRNVAKKNYRNVHLKPYQDIASDMFRSWLSGLR